MRRVRVMIVDDSVVIRRLLCDTLATCAQIEVVTTAANGRLALTKLETVPVDVVVLDIEMPVLDGLSTVREIRKQNRRLPVIMFSTLTERGARATLDALSAGASDYVTKPANVGSVNESREMIRTELIPRILALGGATPPPAIRPFRPPTSTVRPGTAAHTTPHAGAAPGGAAVRPRPAGGHQQPKLLIIGSSTGGPEALNRVMSELPANLGVPVLITQHMPPIFTRLLAERLDRGSALTVKESAGGEILAPNVAYLAPGDFHLEISGTGRPTPVTKLNQSPPENFCRPSVDVLFRSAIAAYGGAVLAVVLTGMGSDGRNACRDVVAQGGQVIVQDQATSVVWGMPGAVASEGLAEEILPLDQIASAITRRVIGARSAATPARPDQPDTTGRRVSSSCL